MAGKNVTLFVCSGQEGFIMVLILAVQCSDIGWHLCQLPPLWHIGK